MKRLLLALLAVLVVLAGAVAAAIWAAPGWVTPRLEAALTHATGHPATIGGVHAAWADGPELAISGLTLANAPWGSRPELLRVARLTVQLDASALLGGTVRVRTIRLERPDLLLETDNAGRGNWETASPPTAKATPQPAAAAPARPADMIGTVVFAGGHIAFRDGKTGRVYQAALDGTAAPGELVRIDATLRGDTAELHVEGSVDPHAPLPRSSLSATGFVTLPERVDVAARFEPGQAGQTVTARAHGAGLEASASGVLDPTTLRPVGPVTLDAVLADGAVLPARLGVVSLAGATKLHLLLRQQGEAATLRDLVLTRPEGDVAGDLDIGLTKPPSLRGSLTSRRLDLEKLLAAFAGPPPPIATPPRPAADVATKPSPAVPLLPWSLLDRGNADLRLAVAELDDGAITLHDLSGHLVVQDRTLSLDPFGGVGPGGRVTLAVHADGRATPPTLAMILHAPALALQPFVTLAGLQGTINGTAAIDADLHAAGANQPELLHSLAGHASVVMGDGDLDLHLLGDVLAAAHLPIDPRGRAHLRCLVVRADIAHGVAALSPLVVDATSVMVQGAGNVDLVQRMLALRLRPLLRTGPGLIVPVTVSGPWTKPKLDLDRADLAGVVAGLAGSTGDACRAAGVASAAPLPAAKALKPADLLRSLLR